MNNFSAASLGFDSVSGATITTKGFREAIADAIKNHSAKKQ